MTEKMLSRRELEAIVVRLAESMHSADALKQVVGSGDTEALREPYMRWLNQAATLVASDMPALLGHIDALPDAAEWVPVSGGELPLAMKRIVILANGMMRVGALTYYRYADRGIDWQKVDEPGYWKNVTHWLRGMPPLPQEPQP